MKVKNKKKRYKNSGYSSGGASIDKNTLKTWFPKHFSAKEDIDRNLMRLRDRAADLAINSPVGSAAIKTQLTGVINAGLKIFPRINSDILNLSADDARAWNRKTKAEFEFWAQNQSCDFYNRNNFYELQRIAYVNQLVDGDCFCLFRRRTPKFDNPYTLKLQLIEAQRVSNPNAGGLFEMNGKKKDSRIVNGIEVDRDGVFQAVWISNRIWNEFNSLNPKLDWRRVKVFGEQSFSRNVLHLCYDTRIEQFRGEPYLSPVIETLKNIDRYSQAELASAIIKAFFALFFTQPEGNFDLNQIGLRNKNPDDPCIDPTNYRAESGSVLALPRGVDVKAIDNSNAQSTFESFTNQFINQASAALGLSSEVILKHFQSSYSASRAALLISQDEFRQRRISFINDFCAPVYENFLAESIALGRINAPNFFDDPVIRAAYCNADWRAEGSHLIDPVKELQAAALKIELGLSTRAKEAAELCGTDFEENLRQLNLESDLLTPIQKNKTD